MILDDGNDRVGRLWRYWAAVEVHEIRSSVSVASGYGSMLRRGHDKAGRPFDDDTIGRFLDDQQKCFARISSWLSMTHSCSLGTRTTLGNLIAELAARHRRLIINREGNLDIPSPSEHLGFILWLLLGSQSQRYSDEDTVRMDVIVTHSDGRIAIGQPDAQELEQWKAIDTTESWWFVDAVEQLRASGYHVDARCKRDNWFIVMTWNRTAQPIPSGSATAEKMKESR